jgi:hypothetical protein
VAGGLSGGPNESDCAAWAVCDGDPCTVSGFLRNSTLHFPSLPFPSLGFLLPPQLPPSISQVGDLHLLWVLVTAQFVVSQGDRDRSSSSSSSSSSQGKSCCVFCCGSKLNW